MSGAIAKRANETSKALGGKVSYAWATFAVFSRWRSGEVTVRVGGEEHRGRMHDVIVANGRYLGGGMKMLPDAEPDDGLFDVLLIGDLTKRDLLLTLPKTYRGRHLPHPKATLLRGATVEIESPEPLPVELDGEQPGTTPVALRARAARPAAARPRLALRLGLRLGGGSSARRPASPTSRAGRPSSRARPRAARARRGREPSSRGRPRAP